MIIVMYALGLLAVAAVVYGVAALVFGRGDPTAPLQTGSTPTALPAEDVTGADIRALRFQQVVRGYKPQEVDWALERLAREIDVLRTQLAVHKATEDSAEPPSATVTSESSEPAE